MSWLALPRQCLFLTVVKVIKAFYFVSVSQNESRFNCGEKRCICCSWLKYQNDCGSGGRAVHPLIWGFEPQIPRLLVEVALGTILNGMIEHRSIVECFGQEVLYRFLMSSLAPCTAASCHQCTNVCVNS